MTIHRGLLLIPAVMTLVGGALPAQRPDSSQVGVKRDTSAASSMRPAAVTRNAPNDGAPTPRIVRVAHGILIGAGVGAATGFLTAIVMSHTGNATDHSEDGLVTASFTVIGSLIGEIIGAFVGLARDG
jgi:hypothetical protein